MTKPSPARFLGRVPGNECYHCGQKVKAKQAHDCWTTTEEKLTLELSEDLMDAWLRLRETAQTFGDQRIYASHKSIMFSRKACYFFVRPKKSVLELCLFLGRTVKAPQVRKTHPVSRLKTAHIVHVTHRDEVEPPITEWLREAYDLPDTPKATPKKPKKSLKKPPREAK